MQQKIILFVITVSYMVFGKTLAQVHLPSGAAQVNIPLYSYGDPNRKLGTSVSLRYTAGNGLKVAEIPSSVGAGWALECGGFIQRIRKGEPDDQKNNDSYNYPSNLSTQQQVSDFWTWATNYYPNGYLYSEYSPSDLVDNGGGHIPLFGNPEFIYKPHQKYLADREQDIFCFSFNGRMGYFVISKKDQNGNSEVKTLLDSKLKIALVYGDLNNSNNIRTTISEFQITDETGIKYVFKDAEQSQVIKYDDTRRYNRLTGTSVGATAPWTLIEEATNMYGTKGGLVNSFVKNKWHLSEIVNPFTDEKITFEYEEYTIDMDGNKSASQSLYDNRISFGLVIERIAEKLKRIKKINLSQKEIVEFQYSTSPRIDIPTDKRLENIVVKFDGVVKQKWSLEHGYFVKTSILGIAHNFSTEEKAWSRLALLKLKKFGTGTQAEAPYEFSYYLGNEDGMNSAVPPLFSFHQDYWGYYNPYNTIGFFNPSNQTNSTNNPPYEPLNGNMLAYVHYTAPMTNPVGFRHPSIEARNGVIKSIKNPFSGEVIYEYEQNYVNSLSGFGGVRVKKILEYDGVNHSKDIIQEYKYVKPGGATSAWGFENTINTISQAVRVYKKCGTQRYPGIDIPQLAAQFSGLSPTSMLSGQIAQSIGNVYGIGPVGVVLIQFAVNIIAGIITDLLTPDYGDYTSLAYSTSSITLSNPLPSMYGRVEVIKKLLSDNVGSTIHEFTTDDESDPDFDIDVPATVSPFSTKQRSANWLYGLEKKVTYLDKNNNPVRVIENIYNPVKYVHNNSRYLSQSWRPNKVTYKCDFYPGFSATNDIDHDLYYPICGRVELLATKEYLYNSSGNYVLRTTDFEYNTGNYMVKSAKSLNSKGELVETNTYYTGDYTLSGVIQSMKDNNMFGVPVSTQTLITKGGSDKFVIDGNVSEFTTLQNGDIKLYKTYGFESQSPIISTSVAFSASQLIPNSSYYKESSTHSYDNSGRPVNVTSQSNNVSTIYDFDGQVIVATAVNAGANEIAYTSFETDSYGNWTVGSGSSYEPNRFITGKRSFSGSLTKSFGQAGNYTVTLWSYSTGGCSVNSQQGTLLATVGDWKLYEWKLTGVSSVQVSGDNIDEVRLYPSKAQMTTITYDPLIGKTSECDAANRIIYYEYDDLGRLFLIRDEKRNVLKTYEYNYKQ